MQPFLRMNNERNTNDTHIIENQDMQAGEGGANEQEMANGNELYSSHEC